MRLHIARLILLTLSLLPILLVGRYIAVQGQPVPYWDEWIKPIKNAVKTAEGRITLSDLVQQYVDSRPLFTNLVTVASVLLVDWNLQAEMYFNMLLAGGTLLLLTGIYRRQHGKSADFVILPFSMLIFSLAQHKSWRFSMQSQHFFLILFVVLTFWSIDRQWSKWTSICLAAFFSLCATFSYANGLLLWFVMVPVLWTLNYRQGKYFVFWLMTTLLALGSFFYEYRIHIIGEGIFLDPLALPQFAAGVPRQCTDRTSGSLGLWAFPGHRQHRGAWPFSFPVEPAVPSPSLGGIEPGDLGGSCWIRRCFGFSRGIGPRLLFRTGGRSSTSVRHALFRLLASLRRNCHRDSSRSSATLVLLPIISNVVADEPCRRILSVHAPAPYQHPVCGTPFSSNPTTSRVSPGHSTDS